MGRTAYRTVDVDGLPVFYREAGPPDAPAILLLHGFPSSSRMWQPLLDRLAGRFRLVAPDYLGFGHSGAPSHTQFAYTFDHLAAVLGQFTQALGPARYSLVMQDYGGPVGFRLAIAHPEWLDALIVQNAVAHEDGLGPLWQTRREFWADRHAHEAALRENFFSYAATRQRHVGTSPNTESYDPDLWTDELAFLSRRGQQDIQTDLFTTTAPTSRAIPPGRTGSANTSRRCRSSGAATTLVPGPGSRGLPQGRARRRGARPGCRPLRPGRAARPDRGPDQEIPAASAGSHRWLTSTRTPRTPPGQQKQKTPASWHVIAAGRDPVKLKLLAQSVTTQVPAQKSRPSSWTCRPRQRPAGGPDGSGHRTPPGRAGQQRRCHARPPAAGHPRRIRAGLRHQPPRPLRPDRAPAARPARSARGTRDHRLRRARQYLRILATSVSGGGDTRSR